MLASTPAFAIGPSELMYESTFCAHTAPAKLVRPQRKNERMLSGTTSTLLNRQEAGRYISFFKTKHQSIYTLHNSAEPEWL